ncbi:hypothetical protein ACHWQZ_G005017 [Mnemiopsis leidyi]
MLKKRLNLFRRLKLAFLLLCLQDFGLLSAAPVLQSSQNQNDNDFLLQAYKEKIERQIKGSDELVSSAPEYYVQGNDNNRHENEYLSQIAQLEAENEMLRNNMKSLQVQDSHQINEGVEGEFSSVEENPDFLEVEAMTDDDLNYPVLPAAPEEEGEDQEPQTINRKRGSWHKLIQGDQSQGTMEDVPDYQFNAEQGGNPSFGHAGIVHQQSSLLDQGVKAPVVAAAEGAHNPEKKDDGIVLFQPVETAGESKGDSGRTATADVVTLTVAAIALLCSVIFIVFTAVQWRKTIKAIKIDQMRSNQSMKRMRSELKIMRSLSSIHIDQDFDDLFNSYKAMEEQEEQLLKEANLEEPGARSRKEAKLLPVPAEPGTSNLKPKPQSKEESSAWSSTSLSKNKRRSSNHSNKVRARRSEGDVAGQPTAEMSIAARTSSPPKPKKTRASQPQPHKQRVLSDEEMDRLLRIAENLDTESDE